jgi:hypothetical protein
VSKDESGKCFPASNLPGDASIGDLVEDLQDGVDTLTVAGERVISIGERHNEAVKTYLAGAEAMLRAMEALTK